MPNKLIKRIANTLQDTNVRVKMDQNYTEDFEISTGVKQDDPLSTTLFRLVIDDIIKQLELRGNFNTFTLYNSIPLCMYIL
jgi:lipopolysaccharide biosynthesis glycosyltransferase